MVATTYHGSVSGWFDSHRWPHVPKQGASCDTGPCMPGPERLQLGARSRVPACGMEARGRTPWSSAGAVGRRSSPAPSESGRGGGHATGCQDRGPQGGLAARRQPVYAGLFPTPLPLSLAPVKCRGEFLSFWKREDPFLTTQGSQSRQFLWEGLERRRRRLCGLRGGGLTRGRFPPVTPRHRLVPDSARGDVVALAAGDGAHGAALWRRASRPSP